MGLPESSRGMRVFKSGSNAKLCSKPIVPGCYVEPVDDRRNRRAPGSTSCYHCLGFMAQLERDKAW